MFSLAPTHRFYSIHDQVSGRAPSEFGIACNVKVIKGYQLKLAHFVCYPPIFRSYILYLRTRLTFNIIIYWVYQCICCTRRLRSSYSVLSDLRGTVNFLWPLLLDIILVDLLPECHLVLPLEFLRIWTLPFWVVPESFVGIDLE